MVTEQNIIMISGLDVVDPSSISWKTEKVIQMLLRFGECCVCLLVNTVEILENTRICVTDHKRERVTNHRIIKLLLLRMAGSVKIHTNTA